MDSIIVLGIGNQLMMDDGIGIYIVEKLKKQNKDNRIQYVIGESDIDYCLNVIEKAEFIIIVDAAISGKTPGEITVFPLHALTYQEELGFSSHNLHFLNLICHSNKRYKGIIIGIEPHEVNFHFGLSHLLDKRFSAITKKVNQIINKHVIGR
ncbi:hydrogenase maturation protease [Bacillus taeanensis]|uniref:Hydrogenase maturation protease n=1 Tax=Bacillus taeanensis TaxID=273032 RepID=A0A366XX50_9BACI|nr:hydrogenase maturation protease [Bacillus taeanensis]RBW70970.1 hydrogenase maturation protease [Bacillus taeanensis]